MNGAFVLLGRSLRVDSRSWPAHLVRFGLLAAIYSSLCFALLTERMFGAPGLRFFRGISYLDAVFMTLMGIGFFATAITEEKEEDTLGLMLMAGISPLGILAGKSGGRFWQSLLLVASQYPFMLLAITMGGVTANQVWSVTVALLAYMIFLGGFGLLCSTIAPRSRTAGTWMVIGLAFYFIIPSMAKGILWLIGKAIVGTGTSLDLIGPFLDAVGSICVFFQIEEILETGFNGSPYSIQVYSNSVAGIVCAGLSWPLFGLATRSPSTESSSRGLVARRRAFFPFSAGRPWPNPFIWKDFHFVSGGMGMTAVRVAYYFGVWFFFCAIDFIRGSTTTGGFLRDVNEEYLVFTSLSVAIDASLVLARSLHDEVRGQTLSTLVMLPRSSIGIVYAKFAGALLGWWPGPVIELIAAASSDQGRHDLWSLMFNEGGGWALVLLFVLIPHFSALAALYVRWAAVPIGIGLTIGVYFAIIGGLSMGMNGSTESTDTFLAIAAFAMFCVCVACHIGILLRVQALGAR